MQAMIIKHLRAITHSFAHLQHESTQHIHVRCKVLTATAQMLKESTALTGRLRLLQTEVPFVSDAQLESARAYAARLQVETDEQRKKPEPAHHSEEAYQCLECNRAFHSFRLLRSHEAKWHGKKTPQATTDTFDRNLHGLHGLPTCRHCGTRFRQWDSLVQHIRRKRCQSLRNSTPPPAPTWSAEEGKSTSVPTRTKIPPAKARRWSDPLHLCLLEQGKLIIPLLPRRWTILTKSNQRSHTWPRPYLQ